MTPPGLVISPDDWAIVQGVLRRHVAQHTVWAFGSRTRATDKEYADLDLALKVDVIDWAGTDAAFRNIVGQHKVVVQTTV